MTRDRMRQGLFTGTVGAATIDHSGFGSAIAVQCLLRRPLTSAMKNGYSTAFVVDLSGLATQGVRPPI